MKSLASLGQEVSITLPLESSSREARANQRLLQNVAAALAVLGVALLADGNLKAQIPLFRRHLLHLLVANILPRPNGPEVLP
jgi:hypothetical protein